MGCWPSPCRWSGGCKRKRGKRLTTGFTVGGKPTGKERLSGHLPGVACVAGGALSSVPPCAAPVAGSVSREQRPRISQRKGDQDMGFNEWMRFQNAHHLIHVEPFIREALRNGTYHGSEPIEDEWQLDKMVAQARREVEVGEMFHFNVPTNNYHMDSYRVLSFEEFLEELEEEEKPRRSGLLGWLFGRS